MISLQPTENSVRWGSESKTYSVNFNKVTMRSQSCIIFDWDDTLLASTSLARHTQKLFYKKGQLPPAELEQVKSLEKIAL